MNKLYLLLPVVAILSSLQISCNKKTDNPAAFTEVNGKIVSFAYPHEKSFSLVHGLGYLKDKAQCVGCHGADGSGGTTKVSCNQCHGQFPHPAGWGEGGAHKLAFEKNPSSCASCHKKESKEGSAPACSSCHSSYPHSPGWAQPQLHGKSFLNIIASGKGKNECLSCHFSGKSEKPTRATDCAICHAAYPAAHETENFREGAHGDLARTYEGQCLLCHRGAKENMPTKGAEGGCYMCHGPETNKIKVAWADKDGKWAALRKLNDRIPSSPNKPKKLKKPKKSQ